jgi:hypothetical protein
MKMEACYNSGSTPQQQQISLGKQCLAKYWEQYILSLTSQLLGTCLVGSDFGRSIFNLTAQE